MIAAPPDASLEVDPLALLRDPPGPPRWHLRVSGIESGPVTWEVLRQLARDGTLKPTDHVRRSDEDRWVPAAEARYPEAGSPAGRPGDSRARLASRFAAALAAAAPAGGTPSAPAPAAAPATTEPVTPAEPAAATVAAAKETRLVDRPGRRTGSGSGATGEAPPGRALLALGLSLVGLVAFALPLGLLAVYWGGSSAAGLARRGGRRLQLLVALAAVAVGLADAGYSLCVLGGRLADQAAALRQ